MFDGRATARPARSEVGDWLDPQTCGCLVTADLREQVRAHESWNVAAEVQNAGDAWLASVEPHPVLVASRWIAADGSQRDGDRVPLPWVLAPGERAQVTVPLTAPGPGTYRLSVSLVQEQNFWFDDVDPSAAASATVHVG